MPGGDGGSAAGQGAGAMAKRSAQSAAGEFRVLPEKGRRYCRESGNARERGRRAERGYKKGEDFSSPRNRFKPDAG